MLCIILHVTVHPISVAPRNFLPFAASKRVRQNRVLVPCDSRPGGLTRRSPVGCPRPYNKSSGYGLRGEPFSALGGGAKAPPSSFLVRACLLPLDHDERQVVLQLPPREGPDRLPNFPYDLRRRTPLAGPDHVPQALFPEQLL